MTRARAVAVSALAVLAAIAAALLQQRAAATAATACRAAESAVAATIRGWPLFESGSPLAIAESLAPVWHVLVTSNDPTKAVAALGDDAARCCAGGADVPGCNSLVHAAFPLIAFMDRLRAAIDVPRQAALRGEAGAASASSLDAAIVDRLRATTKTDGLGSRAARVAVVGGGPSGLTAALVAHREGANVTLIEKRDFHYSRPVWFDLEPGDDGEPTTQAQLRAWGFFELRPPVVPDDAGSPVVTVQCFVLERFLALAAALAGVTMRAGDEFCGVCADDDGLVALAAHGGCADGGDAPDAPAARRAGEPLLARSCTDADRHGVTVPFDILVGADGPRSRVRDALDLTYAPRARFSAADGSLWRTEAALSQVTLILAFELDAGRRCPALRRDATGVPLPPHEPSFDEPGVSTVFKRFFEPYCELQLLFEETLGAELLAVYETEYPGGAPRWSWGPGGAPAAALERDRRALPLPLLRRVTATILAAPFASDDALLAALRRPVPHGRADASLFRMAISAASAGGRVLSAPAPYGRLSTYAIALLRGDALASAHYRLGLGVNEAFKALPALADLLRVLGGMGGPDALRGSLMVAKTVFGATEAAVKAGADRMVNRQLFAIYFEAVCGFLVFGGDDAQQVYRRRHRDRQLELLPSDALDGLNCTAASTAASRAQRTR